MSDKKVTTKALLKRLETTITTLEGDLYEDTAITNDKAYEKLYKEINPGFPINIEATYRS